MLFRFALLFCIAVTVAVSPIARRAPAAEPLRIGLAETDITPPQGFPMAGYYHERLAAGTRDPLKAKAVVFRQGEVAAAWVVADLTGISRDLYVAARDEAAKKTGIPPAHIVISATHSHTAPDYSRHLYDYLAAPPEKRDADSYPARLIGGIAGSIEMAERAARPAKIAAANAAQQTPVSFNRRFLMRDGSIRTWQRLDHPDVVRSAGPIDPEIGILQIHPEGSPSPAGLISNFALHLDTVGGTAWSADFPYFIEQSLRKKLGPELISIFGPGTCGDINHVDPVAKERNPTALIGQSLAATIETALPQLKEIADPVLQVRTATVHLPMEKVSAESLQKARELIPTAKAGGKVEFFDLVPAYKAVILAHLQSESPPLKTTDFLSWGLSHEWAGVGDSLPVDVTTITFGQEVAMVFLPGEVFVDLGLAIKRGSPFPTTMVVELTNCVETIYIPTRAAYVGGGYEVVNSAVQPGSGEMLVEAALQQLRASAASQQPAGQP
jgi:neutral ceramidase